MTNNVLLCAAIPWYTRGRGTGTVRSEPIEVKRSDRFICHDQDSLSSDVISEKLRPIQQARPDVNWV